MITLGYFSIVFALILTAYAGFAILFGLKNRIGEFLKSAEHSIIATFFCLTAASAVLLHALITKNFQIEYVAQHTNKTLPFFYTLTAFYAGQKGSLLFWTWLLALFAPWFPGRLSSHQYLFRH